MLARRFGNHCILIWILFTNMITFTVPERFMDGFSLVIHHFASHVKTHPHHSEVETAIVGNIVSNVFYDIHIVYQTNSSVETCGVLLQRLQNLTQLARSAVLSNHSVHTIHSAHTNHSIHSVHTNHSIHTNASVLYPSSHRNQSLIHCTEVAKQATYRDLFQYAFFGNLSIETQRVVLANADCVFDETLHKLANTTPGAVNLLSVHGFPPTSHPLHTLYHSLHPQISDLHKVCNIHFVANLCVIPGSGQTSRIFQWPAKLRSWDAYVVHLPAVISFVPFTSNLYMNMLAAEHRGACAFRNVTRVHNACKWVNLWHFHCMGKMHLNCITHCNSYYVKKIAGCYDSYHGCVKLEQCF